MWLMTLGATLFVKATIGQGLFDTNNPGDLTDVSLSRFLADIVLLIKPVCKPFQIAPRPDNYHLTCQRYSSYKTWMQ